MTCGALQRVCCVCVYTVKRKSRKWEADNRERLKTLSVCGTCLEVKGADLSGEAADVDDR